MQTVGDISNGISQEGIGGILDPAGMMDRQAAQRELRDKFQITKPEDMACKDGQPDNYSPNQVSEEEFEKIARTYSDVRRGTSDLKFGDDTDDKYKQGAMTDIASVMQTPAGRALMYQMDDNTAGEKDADGNPVHHTTTLHPYLKPDGTPDQSNSDELGLNVKNHNDENGQGVDSRVRYNPGLDVGNGAQPWWPARSDAIFMHEMTHAYYDTTGKTDNGMVDPATGDGVPGNVGAYGGTLHRYEHQAAGLGNYADAPISENKYRDQRAELGQTAQTEAELRPGDIGMAHRDYY